MEKANVEGGMNSIEAGATAVHITLNHNSDGKGTATMQIKDDGMKIPSAVILITLWRHMRKQFRNS